jgi:molybdenum cofactor cytidylyltransferase
MIGIKRIGVLLAAGRSERMGRPKQLLPWPPNSPDGKPLVAAAFDAVSRICDEMFIVLGHEADAVMAALGDRRCRHLTIGNPSSDMFQSVRAGLGMAPIDCRVESDTPVQLLLHPADHPEVRRDTLEAIVLAAKESPERAVMPQFRGRGGHPVLIPPPVAKLICGYEGIGGLRQFWLDYPEHCLRLPVDDGGVVFDVDTQSDYDLSRP